MGKERHRKIKGISEEQYYKRRAAILGCSLEEAKEIIKSFRESLGDNDITDLGSISDQINKR